MNQRESITAGEISVLPIPYIEITSLEITERSGDHSFVYVEGKISAKDKRELDHFCRFGTEMTICKGTNAVLFYGLITELTIKECADVVTVVVRGASHTILLDREKKTKPFHDVDKTIKAIIQSVTEETAGAKTIVENRCEKQVEQFMMQYEETDWEFIKRIASHCGQHVFPDSGCSYPAYYVGKPTLLMEVEIADDIPYTLNWNDEYEESATSNAGKMKYVIKVNDRCLKLGECVKFKGTVLFVRSLRRCLEQAVLNDCYDLCSREGLDTPFMRNSKLAGKEVMGTVSAIRGDHVNVQVFADDGNGSGKACWFVYSTVYASSGDSGWYCMPEVGDKVRIRFPNDNENDAYAISSVSDYSPQNGKKDRMRDYSVRYIRNKQGMEVMWSPDRVSISANGASLIDINKNGTLFISSDSKVTIHANQDVRMEAGNEIHISGGGGIRISCGAKAEITMDDTGIIELKGNEIHTN